MIYIHIQLSKTTKFVKGLVVFLSLYSIKMGPSNLVQICEEIQEGLFGMLLEKIIIADLQKVAGSLERKIVAVGMSNLLSDCPQFMITGKYRHVRKNSNYVDLNHVSFILILEFSGLSC